jgi:hypothetical protein
MRFFSFRFSEKKTKKEQIQAGLCQEVSNLWFKRKSEGRRMGYINRPDLTEEMVRQIRSVIEENPAWNRTKISQEICRLWGWQSPNGQMKDISARDMLRKLDRAGKIALPPRQGNSRITGSADKVTHFEHDTAPIHAKLSALRPLSVSKLGGGKELAQFKSMIDQYHYLGYDRSIGENMKYMVRDRNGRVLACLLFGSASWSCRDRDNYIGWGTRERARGLRFLTNNSRYLILPWVSSLHLASHVLSLISRRIADDWQIKYGHPVHCLETYVETGRFKGTCYHAANWVKVGTTSGRGRDGGHHDAVLPVKDVYLYPLAADFRTALANTTERRDDRTWA